MEINIGKKQDREKNLDGKWGRFMNKNSQNSFGRNLNLVQREGKQGIPEKEDLKDNKKTIALIDWIIKVSIYALVFLLPLFFLSVVPSFLELNKQFLLVILVGIGFLAWVGKMAWLNEIRFKKNFILIPVLTLVGILSLSSFFSVYPSRSVWGEFGQEGKSLISLIFFVAFFILIYNNIKNKKDTYKVIFTLLVSGFLASFYGLMQIWGKFIIDNEAIKDPSFNTIGTVYLLGVYVAALLILTLSLFLDNVSRSLKIILILLSVFFFFVLLTINLSLIWKILLIAVAIILGFSFVKASSRNSQARLLPMVYLVLIVLVVLINKPIIKSQMPTEVYPNYKTSLKIMASSWKEDALLGKGLGNYQLTYKLNRPEGLGDFWSVDFTSGNSFFTTLGTTTGILGTFSYLFLVFSGLVVFLKIVSSLATEKKDEGFMIIGIGSSWIFLTIMMFFYFANITTLMLWWLTLALMISIVEFNRRNSQNNEFVATSQNPRSSFSLSFTFVLVIIGLIAAVYLQGQSYLAAAHFYKALKEDASGAKVENVMERLLKAANLDTSRDVYYRNISLAAFALANQRVAEKGQELSADDSAYISAMIRDALKSADAAVMLNPEDSQNYIALASVYEGVIATMEGAEDRAMDNYRKAIEYDPKNPAIYQKIANIYVTLSDIELSKAQQQSRTAELPEKSKEYLAQAKENINQALKIKNDYADANLLLSSIYEREGAIDSAIENEIRNKELYAGDPIINFRLGLLYYKKEAHLEAEQEFLQALKLNNKYANARYFLGLTYDKQGEKDKALEQLRLVQKDNQENNEVKKMIENLEAGRNIMDGLSQQDEQVIQEQHSQSEGQPSNEINPQFQQQQIPQEAVPQLDEIDENNSPENIPEEPGENPESENSLESENLPEEEAE